MTAGVYAVCDMQYWVVAKSEREAAEFTRENREKWGLDEDADCSADGPYDDSTLAEMTFQGDEGQCSFLEEFSRGQAAGEPVPRYFAAADY